MTAPASNSPLRTAAFCIFIALALVLVHPGTAYAADGEGNPIVQTIARLFNFGVLVWLLLYFLKAPAASYLASRSSQIRQDLVAAAETREAATRQLAEIRRKLDSLPAELAALKAQGADDVKAEKARIAQLAAAERERLLEQTRREIQMRLRVARRELVDLAATLTVGAAREKVTRSITPEDQMRLLDRYTTQLRSSEAR